MTDTPTGPLLASEVLADQHYANFVGNSDTGFDAEGQVDALLACVPEGRDLVIRADGTMAELPTLSEEEQRRHERYREWLACDDWEGPDETTAKALRFYLPIIGRLATPSSLPAPEEEG